MKTFLTVLDEMLVEKIFKDTRMKGHEVAIFIDPTLSEVDELLKRPKAEYRQRGYETAPYTNHELGAYITTDHLYLWDRHLGNGIEHHEIWREIDGRNVPPPIYPAYIKFFPHPPKTEVVLAASTLRYHGIPRPKSAAWTALLTNNPALKVFGPSLDIQTIFDYEEE